MTAVALEAVGWRHVCVAAGITYRQLDYWQSTGILEPLPGPRGSGIALRYDRGEVRVAWAVARFAAGRQCRAPLRRIAEAVRNHPGPGVLCVDATGVSVVTVGQLLPLARVTSCLYLPATNERTVCA